MYDSNTFPPDPNPSGLCMCGCGEPTRVTGTQASMGRWRGHHARYRNGHNPGQRLLIEYLERDCGYTTPCWVWQGALSTAGYGRVHINDKTCSAHRVYYERFVGPIPEGLQIDHLCRNRACVNPDHLEPVTGAVNVRRGLVARLTESDVESIRISVDGGEEQKRLARKYGVSEACISRIQSNHSWKA